MSEEKQQNYTNHVRYDPPFHFVLMPMFLLNLVYCIVQLIRHPAVDTGWNTVLGIGFILLALKARLYALRVQDRVIRLEERLRLSALLAEPLRSRIGELETGQLIALRFAPDNEVPVLVDRALSNRMKAGEIKKSVDGWRPDQFRV